MRAATMPATIPPMRNPLLLVFFGFLSFSEYPVSFDPDEVVIGGGGLIDCPNMAPSSGKFHCDGYRGLSVCILAFCRRTVT